MAESASPLFDFFERSIFFFFVTVSCTVFVVNSTMFPFLFDDMKRVKPTERATSFPDKRISPPEETRRVGARKVKNIVSAADHVAMNEHYSFLPPEPKTTRNKYSNRLANSNVEGGNSPNRQLSGQSSWQERMVAKYHEHLFKEFALADLSVPGRIGLRWRTRQEVLSGRGDRTCGNKRCRNSSGVMDKLVTLEVPFSYEEHGERKKELVKLRLCVNCRPLLSYSAKRSYTKGVTSPKTKLEQNEDSTENSTDSEKTTKRKLEIRNKNIEKLRNEGGKIEHRPSYIVSSRRFYTIFSICDGNFAVKFSPYFMFLPLF